MDTNEIQSPAVAEIAWFEQQSANLSFQLAMAAAKADAARRAKNAAAFAPARTRAPASPTVTSGQGGKA